MRLYLVQHGKAISEELDSRKPLSEEGKIETERVAQFLKTREIKPELIWHSEKLRARETGEIFAEIIGVSKREERKGLAPNDSVIPIRDEIESMSIDLMIIGHLPFLSKLCSLLLTGNEERTLVEFRYSGVLCLDSEGGWKILWYLRPDII
jgi:phosphohistidine phosphatase